MKREDKLLFANKYLLNKDNKYANFIYKESYFKNHYPEIYDELNKIDFPDDFKFGQKLWHFIYDDYDFDKRCNCNLHGKLKFLDFRRGYRQFCKAHCDEYNRHCNIKGIETRIKNCGSIEESYKMGVEKQINTCIQRYGTTNAGGTKQSLEKGMKTILEKFGSFEKMHEISKERSDKTRIEKYGSVEESYKCANKKRSETLKGKTQEYFDNITKKVKLTKLKKYGDENYINIEKYRQTCLDKYGVDCYFKTDECKKINLQHTHAKTLQKYPEIIYQNDDVYHCKCIDKNCTFCEEKEFDIHYSNFYNRKKLNFDICTNRSPEKIYSPISGEEMGLLFFIKSIYSGTIVENDRKILNGKELDIYLPNMNLAFEFNGVYWHNEFNKSISYHQDKSINCMKKNIQLIYIWEDDWNYKKDIVKDIIKSKLNLSSYNIGARKCQIKEVSNKDAFVFLNNYHIQGGVKNGKTIGLYYDNELIEIMTFGSLRKNMGGKPKEGYYEIYRVCSKSGYNVQGGFSRLLKYFEDNYHPIQVTTYANLDYSYGNVYLRCGFVSTALSKPTYTWVVKGVRQYRSNFMKSKLEECKKNPNLTESEIMHNRGYWKCWDSGKIKFVKDYKY